MATALLPPRSSFLRLLPLIAFTIYAGLAYGPVLADGRLFEEDVVQHYLWLIPLRFDGTLAQDVYTSVSGQLQPIGYWLLLRGAVLLADPLTICRWGVLLPLALSFFFSYRLIARHFSPWLAVAAAVVVCQLTFGLYQGMLARSFCIPLLLAGGLSLGGRHSLLKQCAVLLLSAGFYPPALLLNAVGIVGWQLGQRRLPIPLLVSLAMSGLISWLHLRGVTAHPYLGEFINRERIRGLAEFADGGRVNFRSMIDLPVSKWLRYFLPLRLPLFGTAWPAYLTVGALPVVAYLDRKRTAALSGWLLWLLLATVIWFTLAKEFSPRLFLPERYLSYPWRMLLPLATVYLLAVAARPRRWVTYALAVTLLAYGYHRRPPDLTYLYTTDYDRSVLAAIDRLPPDACIAGPFNALSQVPFLLHRPVLVSTESAHALYFEHYYDYVTPRMRDQLAATLAPADSLVRVVRFLDKYEVDYLLHAPLDYRKELFRAWAPYNRAFRDSVRIRDSTDFALLHLPDSLGTVIEEGNFRLYSTEELRRQLP